MPKKTKQKLSRRKRKLDHKRLKTQKADGEGVRNNVDDIQTHKNTSNLSQEDLLERVDEEENKDILVSGLNEMEENLDEND